MERTSVDAQPDGTGGQVAIGEAVDTTDVAINHYQLEPGAGFPSGLHAHVDQEEVFVVLDGEARFSYLPEMPAPDGEEPTGRELTVAAGGVLRFEPGEFQTGWNPESATEPLRALALGAPKPTADVRIPALCPDCGESTLRLGTEGDAFTFDCPTCTASFLPEPCEVCDTHALGMALDDTGVPVSRCDACGHEHDDPPMHPTDG